MTVRAVQAKIELKLADEIFIAAALLHREKPQREDFTIEEIVERVAQENIVGELRPGVPVHVTAHCVANRKPKPSTLRMLYATGRSTRRLYKPDDPADPGRTGRSMPEAGDIPSRYHYLLDWYQNEYVGTHGAGDNTGWLAGAWKMVGGAYRGKATISVDAWR